MHFISLNFKIIFKFISQNKQNNQQPWEISIKFAMNRLNNLNCPVLAKMVFTRVLVSSIKTHPFGQSRPGITINPS